MVKSIVQIIVEIIVKVLVGIMVKIILKMLVKISFWTVAMNCFFTVSVYVLKLMTYAVFSKIIINYVIKTFMC